MFDFFLYPHFLLPERGSSRSREKTCRASFRSHSSGLFPVVAGAWGKGRLVVSVISIACLAKIRIKVGMGKAKRQRDAGGKWRLTVSGLTSPALEKTTQGFVFSKVRIEKTKVRIVFGEGMVRKSRPV